MDRSTQQNGAKSKLQSLKSKAEVQACRSSRSRPSASQSPDYPSKRFSPSKLKSRFDMNSAISNDQSQYREDEAQYEREISDENDRHHGTMISSNNHSKKRFRRSSSSEDDAEFIKAYNQKVASNPPTATQKVQSRGLLRIKKSASPSDSSSFDLEVHLSKKRSRNKGLTNDDEGAPSRAGKKLNIRGPAGHQAFKTVNRTQVDSDSSQDLRRDDSVINKKRDARSSTLVQPVKPKKQPFMLKASHSRKSSFQRSSASSDLDVQNRSRRAQADRSMPINMKKKSKSGGGNTSKSPRRRPEPSDRDILPQADLKEEQSRKASMTLNPSRQNSTAGATTAGPHEYAEDDDHNGSLPQTPQLITEERREDSAARHKEKYEEQVGELCRPLMGQLIRQCDTLNSNTYLHRLYHGESQTYQHNVEGKKAEGSSIGTISSAEEQDCELLFSGEFQYRFQAINKIEKMQLENQKILDKQIANLKLQNSRWRKFKRCIMCKKNNNKIGNSLSMLMIQKQIGNNSMSMMGKSRRNTHIQSYNPNGALNVGLQSALLKQMQGSQKLAAADLKGPRPSSAVKLNSAAAVSEVKLVQGGISKLKAESFRKDGSISAPEFEERLQETPKSPKQPENSQLVDQEFSEGSKGINDEQEDPENEDDIVELSDEIDDYMDDDVSTTDKPNCFTRLNHRMTKFMIDPTNPKLKQFHLMVALAMYVDVFVTSMLIGNYRFQTEEPEYEDFMNHRQVYTGMLVINGLDILLNFFKTQIVDVHTLNTPKDIAIHYIKDNFVTDIISAYPYNFYYRGLLILRFMKLRRFSQSQQFLESYISDILSDYIDAELLKKLIDTISMTLVLFLISHFFACLWILIGWNEKQKTRGGWIQAQVDADRQSTDMLSLYISAFYWIIASFSSVGYGDITPQTESEMTFALFIEMLGICVFGYMIGTIQTLFTSLKIKDQNQDLIDSINLWLILVDKAKPSHLLYKKVFDDVRDFYTKKLKHEAKLDDIDKYYFFEKLKPRLQKNVLDSINRLKYIQFEHLFEDCSVDFQREIIFASSFSYYNAKQEDDQDSEFFNELELPVIEEAFSYSKNMSLIISGSVHIMDQAGMYDYGIIKSGSYFGDISLLLNKPNQFSIFYNPHQEKPLQILSITAEDFNQIMSKYPLEHEIWRKRAVIREEMFASYKSLTLLKYMKTIIKNPLMIIQNRNIKDTQQYSLIERVGFLREKELKLKIFELFIRQYDIQRQIKKVMDNRMTNKHSKKHSRRAHSNVDLLSPMTQNKSHYEDASFGGPNVDGFDISFKQGKKMKLRQDKVEQSVSDLDNFDRQTQNNTQLGATQIDIFSSKKKAMDGSKYGEAPTPGFDSNKKVDLQTNQSSIPRDQEFEDMDIPDTQRNLLGGQEHEGGNADEDGEEGHRSTEHKRNGQSRNGANRSSQKKWETETPKVKNVESSYGESQNDQSFNQSGFMRPQPSVQRLTRHSKTFFSQNKNQNITSKNLKNCGLQLLNQMYAENLHDTSILMAEYFFQKKRQIRKTKAQENNLMKMTQMMKKVNHKTLQSKYIHHMDNIIEEYINLDILNDQLLFDEPDQEQCGETRNEYNKERMPLRRNNLIANEDWVYQSPTFQPQGASQWRFGVYPVTSRTVAAVAYNEHRLDQVITKQLKHDVELNEEFNLLKLHQIHYLRLQVEEAQKMALQTVTELGEKIEKLQQMDRKKELGITELFETLPPDKQNAILKKIESKLKTEENEDTLQRFDSNINISISQAEE